MKARYVGVGRGCGAYTVPRNGKGDAYAYCKRCHSGAIGRHWTQERVVEAMLDWRRRYRAPLDAGAGGRGDAGLAPSLPGATGRRSGWSRRCWTGAVATGRHWTPERWPRRCWTGAVATGRHWTQERVVEAMLDWRRRYRAPLDAGAGGRGDAGLAPSLRQAAVLVRLVAHPRARARGRGAQAADRRRMAGGERGQPRLRRLGGGRHGGWRERPERADALGAVAGVGVGQQLDLAAYTPGIDRKIRGSKRR